MGMAETAEQYRERLASYLDGKDFLVLQGQAPGRIARLIDAAQSSEVTRKPAPGKWSVLEIIVHLAEDELTSSWRYRQMLERDGATLQGFDQDLWARLGDYANWPAQDALDMFRLLREANLRMLAKLSPAEWERSGVHEERGRITVRELARHMAAHDINHIKQIEAILEMRARTAGE
jgi:DinB superfamily